MQEFWLFGFEWYNGILGNQPNNNRDIEPQLMDRFWNDNAASVFTYPDHFQEEFWPVYESVNKNRLVRLDLDTMCDNFMLPMRYVRAVLSPDEIKLLKDLCFELCAIDSNSDITVNSIFLKFSLGQDQ